MTTRKLILFFLRILYGICSRLFFSSSPPSRIRNSEQDVFPLLNMSQWWSIMGVRLCSFCHRWRSYKHVWLNFALLDRVCYSFILFFRACVRSPSLSLSWYIERMTLCSEDLISCFFLLPHLLNGDRLRNLFDQNKSTSIVAIAMGNRYSSCCSSFIDDLRSLIYLFFSLLLRQIHSGLYSSYVRLISISIDSLWMSFTVSSSSNYYDWKQHARLTTFLSRYSYWLTILPRSFFSLSFSLEFSSHISFEDINPFCRLGKT